MSNDADKEYAVEWYMYSNPKLGQERVNREQAIQPPLKPTYVDCYDVERQGSVASYIVILNTTIS